MKNRNRLLFPTVNGSTVRPNLLSCVLLIAAGIGSTPQAVAAAAGSRGASVAKDKANAAASKAMLKLQLRFEEAVNQQAMVAHLGKRPLLLKDAGTVELKSRTGPVLSIELEGANRRSSPVGQDRLPGKSNYFLGDDPSRWRRGVDQFSQARVKKVYDGVDLLYYGNGTEFEHDFILTPGSDPFVIRMRINGGKTIIDSKMGDLIVSRADTSDELIHLVRPVAYQQAADGSRKPIRAQYTRNEHGFFGFTLGTYDHALPLTIYPVVTYSTYFGGSNNDEVNDIKTDAAGNLVLLVATSSTDLPVVSQIPNACAGTCGATNLSPQSSPRIYDFYLAKLDPTGQTLLYSTYFGGSADDAPGALFIASDGTLYISGQTQSTDFPVVNEYPSAIPDYRYYHSSTLTKLSADGSTILYSSLIGAGLVSSFENSGYSSSPGSLAVGSNGFAYLIGYACCGHFLDAKNTTFTAGGGSYEGTTLTNNLTDTVTGAIWSTKIAEDIPTIVGGSTAYFGFTAGSRAPTLTSDAVESEQAESVRPAIIAAATTPPPATSRILTWIYVGPSRTKSAQTTTFPAVTGTTYGAAPIQLAATASSHLPVGYTVTGPAKLSGSTLTITGAGEVTVTASQSGNASYLAAASISRSFAVAKASLTVTANSLSRAGGASNPAFTYQLPGFVNGDGASVVSGTATLTTTATATSPSSSYPITFSTEGLTAANYSFNYLPGTLSVSAGTLVIVPLSGNFGSVKVGTTSQVISFTVTNDTSPTMGYLGYTNLGEFYLQPGTCHLVNGEPMLNPGKSCVFIAVFKPTKTGAASGNMSIQTSSGTFNVPMSGTGAAD